MTPITNNLLNNSTNDYNIFVLIKKNMTNGELSISNLSSKNRALLHRICADFGLEHYSTGNYNNRVFVIKDSQHTYFTQTLNDDYWENYLNNSILNNNNVSNQTTLNQNITSNNSNYSDSEEEDEEDEVEDEKDTDTYSSDSESTNSDSTDSISNSEYNNLHLINKIDYQDKMLKYIYILSLTNLILNTYLMFSN